MRFAQILKLFIFKVVYIYIYIYIIIIIILFTINQYFLRYFINIINYGTPIPEAYLPYTFEKYYRTSWWENICEKQ